MLKQKQNNEKMISAYFLHHNDMIEIRRES